MKRTFIDIIDKVAAIPVKVYLEPYNLIDGTYFIWIARNHRFVTLNREIEYRSAQKRLKVRINTHEINPVDFVTEQVSDGLLVKFIKNNFEYILDIQDEIIVSGDLESYA